jgi:hypothetical protein
MLRSRQSRLAPHAIVVAGASARLRERWLLGGWAATLAVYFVARAFVVRLPTGYVGERLRVGFAHSPLLLADVGKLVLPGGLAVVGDPKDAVLWPGAVALALIVAAVALVRESRRRVLALAAASVLCPLIVSLPGTRYLLLDNRLYLPMVGLALLLAEILRAMHGRARLLAGAAVLAIAAWCAHATLTHAEDYRSRESFSEAAMKAAPQSPIVHQLRFRQSYGRELKGN